MHEKNNIGLPYIALHLYITKYITVKTWVCKKVPVAIKMVTADQVKLIYLKFINVTPQLKDLKSFLYLKLKQGNHISQICF